MFSVKDIVSMIKDNITIIIDLGADDYNVCRLTPYHEIEHGHLFVDTILPIDNKGICITVL